MTNPPPVTVATTSADVGAGVSAGVCRSSLLSACSRDARAQPLPRPLPGPAPRGVRVALAVVLALLWPSASEVRPPPGLAGSGPALPGRPLLCSRVTAAGDINGDGRPDLVGRIPGNDGLWLFPSNGATGKGARVKLREFLVGTDMIAAAGFWNNDAVRDLVVRRRGSKDLYLLPGNNDGTFAQPVLLRGGRNFGQYDRLVGVGDFNGDRQPDILAREAGTGRLWLFPGTTRGLLARRYVASGLDRDNLIG